MANTPDSGNTDTPDAKAARQSALLMDATRQFCAKDRPAAGEIEAFKELFYQLAPACNTEMRRQISATLAANPYAPRSIVIYLASDAAAVATPVLLFSPVLNEAHIARLAARLPRSHLLVLCRRASLTDASIRALLANGGEECARQLAKNSASAGNEAVSSAMAREEKREPVPESPPLQNHAPAVSSELGLHDKLLSLAARGGRIPGQRPPFQRPPLRDEQIPFERRLILAARARNRQAFNALIASGANCSPEMVDRLVRENEPAPLAVLMKGVGVDGVTAMQVMLMVKPEVGANRVAFKSVSSLYGRLDPAECRQFIAMLGGLGSPDADTAGPNPQTNNTAAFADAAQSRRGTFGLAPRDRLGERVGAVNAGRLSRKTA